MTPDTRYASEEWARTAADQLHVDEEPWTHRADLEAPSGRVLGWAFVAFVILAALVAVAWRLIR